MGATQVVGNVGLYFAAYRLSRMGWNVMPTARNARGVDLLAYDVSGQNYKSIQIKALSKPCRFCNHQAIVNVAAYDDEVPVPAFGPRMVCTVCGAIGAEARPNWNERRPVSLFGPARMSVR